MAKNDITVKILGDAKGFTQALDNTDSRLGRFGKAAGVVGAGLAGFGVAAIVGLERLGATFDDAYDSIAVATGATGETLAGLEQSFRDVAESGPHAFEDVSTAIGDLNQRLGITGQPLENLSGQFLDLARITDTDVSANIEAATEAFSKFGIPAEDMSASLDELFRASQASGIGVDVLATQMTRFGAPLQALGFGFEESAALLAGFEEAGINTQQVMSGMGRGLAQMARDGEAPAETFARITEQIAGMEDPAEATALAVELFGTKAGPELAAAIQSGTFDLTEMMDVIENGEGSITGTADATDDWREKLTTLRNKVLVRLAPLAEKVFAKITEAMVAFSEWLERNWPQIQATLTGVWEWIQRNVIPIVQAIGRGLVTAFKFIKNQVVPVVVDIALAIADAFQWVRENVVPVVVDVAQAIATAFEWVRTNVVPVVVDIVDGIVTAVSAVVSWFQDNWDTISEVVGRVVDVVVGYVTGLIDGFKSIIAGFKALFSGEWSEAWNSFKDGVVTIVQAVITYLAGLGGLILEGIGNLGSLLLDKGGELLSGLWGGIQAVWDETIKPWFADIGTSALLAIPSLLESIATRGKQLLNGLMNGVRDVWNETIKPWLSKIGTAALLAIPSLLQSIVSRGKQLLNGAMNGIRSVWNDTIKPWLAKLGTAALLAVPSLLESLLSRGKQLLNGVMNGVRSVWNDTLKPWFMNLPVAIANAVGSLFNLGSNIAGGLVRGFASGMASLGSTLWEKFKSAVNTLINGWNNLSFSIGGGSWDPGGIFTPTITIPTLTISTPNIPTLHSGGWVDARRGDEQLALLQDGEYVMSRAELAGNPRADSPVGGQGGIRIDSLVVGSRNDIHLVREEFAKLEFQRRYAA